MTEEKKFYFASVEVTEKMHKFFTNKAEREMRSVAKQLLWELENIMNREAEKK